MPTYTYRCDSNDHTFETVQRFTDDPLTVCPECGSPIRRVIQPVGVVFKGSGWYITDSRPRSGSDGAESKSGDKAKAKTESGESKSETPAKSEKSEKSEKTPVKVAD